MAYGINHIGHIAGIAAVLQLEEIVVGNSHDLIAAALCDHLTSQRAVHTAFKITAPNNNSHQIVKIFFRIFIGTAHVGDILAKEQIHKVIQLLYLFRRTVLRQYVQILHIFNHQNIAGGICCGHLKIAKEGACLIGDHYWQFVIAIEGF